MRENIMNMKREDFKRAYSEYRENVRDAFKLGMGPFSDAKCSNPVFRRISDKDIRPVSIAIWTYLSNKNTTA
jgi:hypothetical protein